MKIKIGKFITFGLALILSMTIIGGVNRSTVLAATITQPLDFTDDSTPSTGDGYSWDSATKTLTFFGIDLDVTTTEQSKSALVVPKGTKIIATTGTMNKINLTAAKNYGYTITSPSNDVGDVTFTGSGSLEISVTGHWTNCISFANGGLIIEDMPNLIITANTSSASSGGIGMNDSVTIKNSNVKITSGNQCISGDNIIIEDSTINMTANINAAVISKGESLIKNSNITMSARTYGWNQMPLNTSPVATLTIDNSIVKASITSNEYVFYGWRDTMEDGFIFKDSIIETSGGKRAVHVNGNGFITFDESKFIVDGIMIADYKINPAFSATTINVTADYSKVKSEITRIPTELTNYTQSSVEALNNAVNAVVFGKYDTEQTTVDSYASAIKKAIDELVLKDADYSKVEKAIAKVPTDLDIYTEESVRHLQNALSAVIKGKDITEQEIVDGYAQTIELAINNLEKKAKAIDSHPSEAPQKVAKTGDSTNSALLIFVMLTSGGFLLMKSRRKHKTIQ